MRLAIEIASGQLAVAIGQLKSCGGDIINLRTMFVWSKDALQIVLHAVTVRHFKTVMSSEVEDISDYFR